MNTWNNHIFVKCMTKTGLYQLSRKPVCWIVVVLTAIAMTGREEFIFSGITIAILIAGWLVYTDKRTD